MRNYIPKLEALESRDIPTTILLGQYGYISYTGQAQVRQEAQNRYEIITDDELVVYSPYYVQAQMIGNVGDIFLSGYILHVYSPKLFVYGTGGTLSWQGDERDESIVDVSQSYRSITTPQYTISFSGFDTATIQGNGGRDRFTLYGNQWNQAFYVTASGSILKHRDGSDTLTGIESFTLNGGGGADLLCGQLPKGSVARNFYTEAYLRSLTTKALIGLSVPISPGSSQTASMLSNYLNQNSGIGGNTSAWLKLTPRERFWRVFVSRQESVICGGLAILYRELSTEFSLMNRQVYLWDSSLTNSHATNEVLINGAWVVEDATYNFIVRDDVGNRLSYAQMRTTAWSIDHRGFSGRWRYNLETYPIPFQSYLAYIAYTPARPARS